MKGKAIAPTPESNSTLIKGGWGDRVREFGVNERQSDRASTRTFTDN